MDDTTRPQPAIDEPPVVRVARPARPGINLYRSPARVGILSFAGFLTYPIWWRWQLFKFTGREAFPRAKSFWWTLVPIYGFVVIWQQLDDLKHAAASKNVRVRAGLIIALLVGGLLAFRGAGWRDTTLTLWVIGVLLGALLTAVGIYLGQRSIVAYLAASYPTERRRGVSLGEIIATLLTVVIVGSVGGLAYYWAVADTSPAVTYLPPASPVADAAPSGGWTQYRDPTSGFAIQLPPDWASVAYDTAARGEEPTRDMKFYAEANNKEANLVLQRWVGRPTTLDEYVARFVAALERDGAGQISHTRVTLSLGEAELVRFSETSPDAGATVTDHFIVYVIVQDRAFLTTIYRMQFRADTFTPVLENTVDSIATSFRVL
jgi:hypothetical protein